MSIERFSRKQNLDERGELNPKRFWLGVLGRLNRTLAAGSLAPYLLRTLHNRSKAHLHQTENPNTLPPLLRERSTKSVVGILHSQRPNRFRSWVRLHPAMTGLSLTAPRSLCQSRGMTRLLILLLSLLASFACASRVESVGHVFLIFSNLISLR